MRKIFKMAAIAAVISMAAVFTVMAQESSTSEATAGIYGTDVNNYMDYHSYSSVEFDKWFSFAGWYGGVWDGEFSLGYAARPGGAYLGLFYNGWGARSEREMKETLESFYNADTKPAGYKDVITYTDDGLFTDNSIAALLGIAGMGIKLGVRVQTESYKNASAVDSTEIDNGGGFVEYTDKIESFTDHHNVFTPFIGWGMGFNVGSMVLKPYLEAGLGIARNMFEVSSSDYYTYNGKVIDTKKISSDGAVGLSHDREDEIPNIRPDITVGLKLGMGRLEIGLKYNLGIDVYTANDYDVFGVSDSIKGSAQWISDREEIYGPSFNGITDKVEVILSENSGMSHKITPSVYYDWDLSDRAKFGIAAEVPVSIYSGKRDKYTITTDTTFYEEPTDSLKNYTSTTVTKDYNGLDEIFNLSITPALSAGTSWVVVPERFTLNTGVKFWPVAFHRETVNTSHNGYQVISKTEQNALNDEPVNTVTVDLNKAPEEKLSVTKTVDSMVAKIGVGFLLNFTPKFALDTSFINYWTNGGFDIDLARLNIVFTIKN